MYKCCLCNYEGSMLKKSEVDNRNILECPNCKLQFMYPQTSDEELNKIYSNNQYPTCSFDNGIDENNTTNMKKKTFNRILKKLLPYCDKGNILDIGCSSGLLLEEAKKLGFEPYGLEISEYASNIAKKRIGEDRIYNGTLDTYKLDKKFDVITMIDVIEHFRNPIEILKISKKILNYNAGGYILITTPNTNSLTNKIMKNKWPHYNAEHLYYFNLKSMEKLSNITGFKILYSSRLTKNMNFKYMYYQFKEHNNTLFKLINIFDKIPIINNISLNISTGDSIFILREDRNI